MLYITFNYDDGTEQVQTWHHGMPLSAHNLGEVTEIQADGDERELVLELVPELRPSERPVQNWKDDFARIIVRALAQYAHAQGR